MNQETVFRNGIKGHHHPNGGGWICDDVSVPANVYVGTDAAIYGGIIYGGHINGGIINGGIIRGGIIYGGTINGGIIYGGHIRWSQDVLALSAVGSESQELTIVRHDEAPYHEISIGCWGPATIDQLADEVQRRCPNHAEEYAEIEVVLRRRIAAWTPS